MRIVNRILVFDLETASGTFPDSDRTYVCRIGRLARRSSFHDDHPTFRSRSGSVGHLQFPLLISLHVDAHREPYRHSLHRSSSDPATSCEKIPVCESAHPNT